MTTATSAPIGCEIAGRLDRWSAQFSIGATPISAFIAGVHVAGRGGCPVELEWRTVARPRVLRRSRVARRRAAGEMLARPFHPAWSGTAEAVAALRAPVLHPGTLFAADSYSLATGTAALLIGCADRGRPDAPLRFNPNMSPAAADIGVIAQPVGAQWLVPLLVADGFDSRTAGVVTVVASIVEFAIHETFELHQTSPGVPVFDPHQSAWVSAALEVATTAGVYQVELEPCRGAG